jgi:hypothetical protein
MNSSVQRILTRASREGGFNSGGLCRAFSAMRTTISMAALGPWDQAVMEDGSEFLRRGEALDVWPAANHRPITQAAAQSHEMRSGSRLY